MNTGNLKRRLQNSFRTISGKVLTAAAQQIGNMQSRFYFAAKGLVRWMWDTFHQLPPGSRRANVAQLVPESCSGGHTDECDVFEVATKPSGYCIGDGLTPGAVSESCHVCQPHCSLWKKKNALTAPLPLWRDNGNQSMAGAARGTRTLHLRRPPHSQPNLKLFGPVSSTKWTNLVASV